MRSEFKFQNPDELVATITMTATVGEWRKLRALLPPEWPAWDVSSQIGDVIRAAEAKFYATEDTTNGK